MTHLYSLILTFIFFSFGINECVDRKVRPEIHFCSPKLPHLNYFHFRLNKECASQQLCKRMRNPKTHLNAPCRTFLLYDYSKRVVLVLA